MNDDRRIEGRHVLFFGFILALLLVLDVLLIAAGEASHHASESLHQPQDAVTGAGSDGEETAPGDVYSPQSPTGLVPPGSATPGTATPGTVRTDSPAGTPGTPASPTPGTPSTPAPPTSPPPGGGGSPPQPTPDGGPTGDPVAPPLELSVDRAGCEDGTGLTLGTDLGAGATLGADCTGGIAGEFQANDSNVQVSPGGVSANGTPVTGDNVEVPLDDPIGTVEGIVDDLLG